MKRLKPLNFERPALRAALLLAPFAIASVSSAARLRDLRHLIRRWATVATVALSLIASGAQAALTTINLRIGNINALFAQVPQQFTGQWSATSTPDHTERTLNLAYIA